MGEQSNMLSSPVSTANISRLNPCQARLFVRPALALLQAALTLATAWGYHGIPGGPKNRQKCRYNPWFQITRSDERQGRHKILKSFSSTCWFEGISIHLSCYWIFKPNNDILSLRCDEDRSICMRKLGQRFRPSLSWFSLVKEVRKPLL